MAAATLDGTRSTVPAQPQRAPDLLRVARWILVIASGVAGTLAGCRPTGSDPADVTMSFLAGAVVAAIGGCAPPAALVVSATIVAAASANARSAVVVVAWLALAGAIWCAWRKPSAGAVSTSVVSTAVAGCVAQVAMRLDLDQFLGASAIAGTVPCLLLVAAGTTRVPRRLRITVVTCSIAGAVGVALAVAGVAVAGARARTSALDGYDRLLHGLDLVAAGDTERGAAVLRDAADRFDQASAALDEPWGQPARLLPGIAQNRRAAHSLIESASDAAHRAAELLEVVDLEKLTFTAGSIDVAELRRIGPPLRELDLTIAHLRSTLDDVDSAWLVPQLRRRIHTARERADEVARQAHASAEIAAAAPSMLGEAGTRRYLFVFGTPAEARGLNGLLGNWSEVTITDGRLDVALSGRISDLQAITAANPIVLDASAEYFDRYGFSGAGGPAEPVEARIWQNATMPPDMPTVGAVLSQLYESTTGTVVDGVLVFDPIAIAGLLQVTGPVDVPALGGSLDATNVTDFLYLDQYALATPERTDLLAEVTTATISRVLQAQLPGPRVLAEALAPAALEGHLSAWMRQPAEQAAIELIGADWTLPRLSGAHAGADGLAVVTQNGGGNKIDSFLRRSIRYDAVYDDGSGEIEATLQVVLDNHAPTTGYAPYVISNLFGLPDGTNRTILSVYTPLELRGVTLDAVPVAVTAEAEAGYNVYSLQLDVAAGSSATIELQMAGQLAGGDYELVLRPQPLVHPEPAAITVRSPAGEPIVTAETTLERRSVLSASGVEAYWAEDRSAG